MSYSEFGFEFEDQFQERSDVIIGLELGIETVLELIQKIRGFPRAAKDE